MSVEVRRASPGFFTREPGRRTRHAFSFGTHYDPDNTGFGKLVCHDDHLVGAGTGFPDHPHAGVEIVTWVLLGALVHTDSGGAPRRLAPGAVAIQRAGTGVVHSEIAAPDAGPTRFVQAWLTPDDEGGDPSYAVADVGARLSGGGLVPVASGHDARAAAPLATSSATLAVARLAAGESVTLPDEPLQHVYVARGALLRSSLAEPLAEGDAFRITDRPGLQVTAAVPSELLVWTFRR